MAKAKKVTMKVMKKSKAPARKPSMTTVKGGLKGFKKPGVM